MGKAQRAKRRTSSENTASQQSTAPVARQDTRLLLVVCAVLVLATLAVYWQVFGCGFIAMDDEQYVFKNQHVQMGLTPASIQWALTTTDACNWHPLTWLSLMTDYQLGGLHPRLFHITNVLLHLLNIVLLVVVLSRMTGSTWRSAFVGALFALHPLHVESVAWISERKDVLSTAFWLLTMLAYFHYRERPNAGRYALVAAAFALGLMAKPMLVTLPVVLLLLDYWPLRRAGSLRTLAIEKLPLLAIAAASCVMTMVAQKAGGAVATLQMIPLGERIGQALVAYGAYVVKMIWPSNLAHFYPRPDGGPAVSIVAVSAAFLVVATYLAVRTWRSRPYLAFGWLWYVITLIPVIGIVQVGSQAMADRYTYLPLIGLFVAIAWGVPEIIRSARACAVVGVAVIIALAGYTSANLPYWQSDATIWTRAIEVTTGNWMAYYNRAVALGVQGKWDQAKADYEDCLRAMPTFADAQSNYGNLLLDRGDVNGAVEHYRQAHQLKPNNLTMTTNLARGLSGQGNEKEAIALLKEALRIDPQCSEARNYLDVVKAKWAGTSEAEEYYKQAMKANPKDPEPYINLGARYLAKHDINQAVSYYNKAIQLDPNYAPAHYALGNALLTGGIVDEAIASLQEAIKLDPRYEAAHYRLGLAFAQAGRSDDAIAQFAEVIKINPKQAVAYNDMGVTLARAGRMREAAEWFQKCVDVDPSNTLARDNLARAQGQLGQKP